MLQIPWGQIWATPSVSLHVTFDICWLQAHVKNAEKYLKTSPLKLKFTPDWDPAGDEFSRAATAYKVVVMTMLKRRGCYILKCSANDWNTCFDVYDQRLQRITASQRNVCFVPSTVTKRFTAFSRQDYDDDRDDDDDHNHEYDDHTDIEVMTTKKSSCTTPPSPPIDNCLPNKF